MNSDDYLISDEIFRNRFKGVGKDLCFRRGGNDQRIGCLTTVD